MHNQTSKNLGRGFARVDATHKFGLGALILAGLGGCSADAMDETPDVSSNAARLEEALPRELSDTTKFFVPAPNPGAIDQVANLLGKRKFDDAARLVALTSVPQAVWFTEGTPKQVKSAVKKTMQAAGKKQVPILVAYNVPYRDCTQYSAGGAADTDAYKAWIDGFADGIGKGKAVVILEPDGLGIIPYNTTIYGQEDWCRPEVTDAEGNSVPAPGASPEERYAQLNYAVDSILAKAPDAAIYLDGTHSSWLGVGEAAYRLDRAGVGRAQGFFLNVSNYRATGELAQFGQWVSACIKAATGGAEWALGHFDWCPSQYNEALGFALDYSPEYAATVTASLANMLGGAEPTAGFVLDTSRNGKGPWTPPADASYPDAQDWCNPPKRGVGLRPTAASDTPLLDALLWVKVPGESDGSCNRGVEGSTTDPEWGGIVDPGAGEWFPQQALELAKFAKPKLF
jgi:endoglucanase